MKKKYVKPVSFQVELATESVIAGSVFQDMGPINMVGSGIVDNVVNVPVTAPDTYQPTGVASSINQSTGIGTGLSDIRVNN